MAQTLEVEGDRLADELLRVLASIANDAHASHAAVPFGTSAFGFPATVTLPGLVWCSYCRWLPRRTRRLQPSSHSVPPFIRDSADLGVSVKADATSYTVGDLVTYTLTVTNYGEATADSVKLIDLLPAGLELVSVDASSSTSSTVAAGDLVIDPNDTMSDTATAARIAEGAKMDLGYDVSSSGGETLVTVSLDSLSSLTYSSASDAMRTITIVARATASGTTTNVASVDSANPDQNEAGNNFALSSVAVAA